jgi:hypothetical protein
MSVTVALKMVKESVFCPCQSALVGPDLTTTRPKIKEGRIPSPPKLFGTRNTVFFHVLINFHFLKNKHFVTFLLPFQFLLRL